MRRSVLWEKFCLWVLVNRELDTWQPEYPIRYWMSVEKRLLDNMFKDVKLLVVAVGIGGKQTLVAKEMMRYCKESYPEMNIYFVGNLPFPVIDSFRS